jgi:hypothetical protein
VVRRSWGRSLRRLGTRGMCTWGSLVGCRRPQRMDRGVRVKFEVGVTTGMPSPVQPAGAHGWRAFGGARFVHETMRVGLA